MAYQDQYRKMEEGRKGWNRMLAKVLQDQCEGERHLQVHYWETSSWWAADLERYLQWLVQLFNVEEEARYGRLKLCQVICYWVASGAWQFHSGSAGCISWSAIQFWILLSWVTYHSHSPSVKMLMPKRNVLLRSWVYGAVCTPTSGFRFRAFPFFM